MAVPNIIAFAIRQNADKIITCIDYITTEDARDKYIKDFTQEAIRGYGSHVDIIYPDSNTITIIEYDDIIKESLTFIDPPQFI